MLDANFNLPYRQINVPVSEDLYQAAKVEAARRGMFFRRWVEWAIASACDLAPAKPGEKREVKPEHTYEPIDS